MSSPDVIHGVHVEHTTIDIMLIRGHISEVRSPFSRDSA
jgi:heme/copper-type cytochrome/quinol oxidase subunit 2